MRQSALVVLLAFLVGARASAQDTLPSEKAPRRSPQEMLDETQARISRRLIQLANRLDSFFGEKRADDELNRSSVRLLYDYRVRDEKRPIDETEVRFNIRLPNLERLFRLSVSKNDEAPTASSGGPQANSSQTLAPPQLSGDAREPWRFRADAGLNVNFPPVVFARSRLRKNWHAAPFIHRFVGEVGWFSDQGWGQNNSLFHDYALRKNLLFRFVHDQSWQITIKEFRTTHGPSLLQTLTDQDALSYNARVATQAEGIWFASNYSLSVSYRRNLTGDWLFGEIVPTLDFPRAERFRRAPSILLRIESLFAQL